MEKSNEQIISEFLRSAYTDEKLAALLAHAEDGKLSYWSCCCFIGIPTADHALRGEMAGVAASIEAHYLAARALPGAELAEWAFIELGFGGSNRCKALAILIGLIKAEMERREQERSESLSPTLVTLGVNG